MVSSGRTSIYSCAISCQQKMCSEWTSEMQKRTSHVRQPSTSTTTTHCNQEERAWIACVPGQRKS
eukprot:10719733-Ditylum_brightwellii.AAC.1